MIHSWEKAYKDNLFSIKTSEPSLLVKQFETNLKFQDKVLDIGCGNGRNAIYLANKGFFVDCFDVADLDWYQNLPSNIKNNIHFEKKSVDTFSFSHDKYNCVIVARVIQYLSFSEIELLFNDIFFSLREGGFVLISYNVQGGIFNRTEIDVPKYSHSVKDVEKLLGKYFKKIIITPGSQKSVHVNFNENMQAYDIFASN